MALCFAQFYQFLENCIRRIEMSGWQLVQTLSMSLILLARVESSQVEFGLELRKLDPTSVKLE